jgi:hypothetical protein
MFLDATPVSPTDGLRFDQPESDSGSPTCARCQAGITKAYYEVNGHVVCAGCKSALECAPPGSGTSRMLRAAVFGFGAAVVGAGIYYAILAATGYELGLVAIVVGWMVGLAVHKGSHGAGGWAYQTLAVGLTYLAIVSTYIPFIFKDDTDQSAKAAAAAPASSALGAAQPADSVTVRPAAATTADSSTHHMTPGRFLLGLVVLILIAAATPFIAGFENILGLIIIGFALFQAWKMNRRVPLVVNGPYAVGRVAGAAAGE